MSHTLSRKYRSCVTRSRVTIALDRYCSSHSTISISKWLVGSSMMSSVCLCSTLVSISSLARATRFICPPERLSILAFRSVIFSWERICFISFSSPHAFWFSISINARSINSESLEVSDFW